MWTLEGLMWQERNLQVSEEANIFDNENRHIEFNGDTREQSTPDEITRLLVDGSLEVIGESLSVSDEDHLVGNVFERPRVKCAMNVSAPDDGDGSSRCRTPWCGGVRGVLANLQKEACGRVQHDCVSRPDQDETLEGSTFER